MQYELLNNSFPVVTCYLHRGEQMITERGSMIWMSPSISMETVGGGLKKMFTRNLMGEGMFQNVYTAQVDNAMIAFGSSFPGKILDVDISKRGSIVVQKTAFLAGEPGVAMSIHFQQKLKTGFFGGEGFIMQRLSGQGMAFLECDGDLVEYDLRRGESLLVDTGHVLGFDETVQMSIEQVQGLKNKLFGGEGWFNTKLTGPGKIWLQTMPISGVASAILPYIPTSNN